MTLSGRVIAPGSAAGPAMVLGAPLSLWGGIDPATGRIIDVHHPQAGACVAGTILVMPAARGSSSSASVLAEAARAGVAPLGIILGEPDLILAIGAAVAEELYAIRLPIVVAPEAIAAIRDAATVRLAADGATGVVAVEG
ncbi:MAG: DUF126 domain-containing protein [Chloroflexota bacterium]|nr:DUF126 domain-containing protein [Chloroflexota bacterium]